MLLLGMIASFMKHNQFKTSSKTIPYLRPDGQNLHPVYTTILQFMCLGSLAGVTYLRYTVLTSPNKGETAVHCCDPPLSVLVMLVSRNVFHVVSALQSVVFKKQDLVWPHIPVSPI